MDAETRRAISKLAQELTRTQEELARVKRGSRQPQLGRSSIDSGALEVRDPETGATRLRLGYQPDGSVGVVPEGGDPPPAPSVPIVAGAPAGVMVQWDGRLADGSVLPSDFDHASVHVSQVQGFAPDAATFQGTIPRSGGLFPVVPLEIGTTYYVRLVGVGTGGAESSPSAETSGVPEAVGGVPEPGSITEVELADDAVTTPKLRAEAVQAWHIAAQAIEAGHIEAGAVEAAHLAATIVLASRLVAGDPSAARVEIDESGLRGYDDDNTLIFAIDDGDAVFSGTVTGSEIVGSRLVLGDDPVTGVVESTGGQVVHRVQSDLRRAQLSANTTQASFLAVSEAGNPNSHSAGFIAADSQVQFGLYSDTSGVGPAVTGVATGTNAELTTWTDHGDTSRPYSVTSAVVGRAMTRWDTPGGGQVQVVADVNNASLRLAGPDNPPTSDKWAHFAGAYGTDDSRALSIRSPEREESQFRSMVALESDSPTREHTRAYYYADEHRVRPGLDGQTAVRPTGVVRLDSGVSVQASAHAPVSTEMQAQPTQDGDGGWHDFTTAQMSPLEFRTGASGRARVTISMCGINNNTNASTISLGFRLSGASTVPPSLQRAAMVRSMGSGSATTSGRQQCAVVYLDLSGESEYTLTPVWRISGSTPWSGHQSFDLNYQQSIVVEPLL